MTITSLVQNLLKGLGIALSQVGVIQELLSSSIADGIESGVNRLMPMLLKNVIVMGVVLTGIILLGIGTSKWAETMVQTPGVGFASVGIVFLLAGVLYIHAKK